MDTVNGWFYGDRIWIQRNRIGCFLEKQEWTMYMYGLIETGYGYSETCFFSGKLKLDWFYRDMIWIQWNRIFSSGKPKLDGFIGTRYGYNGIGFFV